MFTSTLRPVAKITRSRPERTEKDRPAAASGSVDPVKSLCLPVDKVRQVTELHMGGRRLRSVHPNLLKFTNLEVLWLNDNKLTQVSGLLPDDSVRPSYTSNEGAIGLRRLKQLYLSDNCIEHLPSDIERMRYLEVLLLANNQLRNMEVICQKLAQLKSLTQLDLFGNPLAEESNYYLYVVHHLPSVQFFDRHEISEAERAQAQNLFGSHAKSSLNYAFNSTAPSTCNAHIVEYKGKRWRRVWHQTTGKNGIFDLRCSQARELASRSHQVHIRNAGRPSQSVTSKVDTYPIRRLALGKCLSCRDDGRPAGKKDVDAVWEGPAGLLESLACTVTGGATEEYDRPITRVIFSAYGNQNGLRIINTNVGSSAECGWQPKHEDAIEVYVDIGDIGSDQVSDIPQSVRHLQNQVVSFRKEAAQAEMKAKTAHSRHCESLTAKRDLFHRTWERRLGKSGPGGKQAADPSEGAHTRRDVAAALETLKLPSDDNSVNLALQQMHRDQKHVSCLFTEEHGRHYAESEPFVPERDGDCFNDTYNAYTEARLANNAIEEDVEAVQLCFTTAEMSTLATTFGDGDAQSTDVPRASAAGVVRLCVPDAANSSVVSSVVSGYSGRETLPLHEVLVLLTRAPQFIRHKIESTRREAERDLHEGRVPEAAKSHKRMNELANLLTKVRSVEEVGSAVSKHPQLQEKAAKGEARKVAIDDASTTENTPRPELPPCGNNPLFGKVGAGVRGCHGKTRQRAVAKTALVAAMLIGAVASVHIPRPAPLPANPWN